jgi:hypothetical protein
MGSGPEILNSISWWTFVLGLIIVSMAYLGASASGRASTAHTRLRFTVPVAVGSGLMYVSLLIMPAIPLWFYTQQKSINKWDWAAATMQWISYVFLPLGLYWWRQKNTANYGAAALGGALLLLLGSAFAANEASKVRKETKSVLNSLVQNPLIFL